MAWLKKIQEKIGALIWTFAFKSSTQDHNLMILESAKRTCPHHKQTVICMFPATTAMLVAKTKPNEASDSKSDMSKQTSRT